MPSSRRDPWAEAETHLRRTDPVLGAWIDRVGPCPLRPSHNRYQTLVRSIVGQMLSARVARTLNERLLVAAGCVELEPETVAGIGAGGLRAIGLSRAKAACIMAVSEAVTSGGLPLSRAGRFSDAELIARLTELPGIGVWTAQMFLVFALNRPDVLPATDQGIRAALKLHFGLHSLPDPHACETLTEPWRPHRTVAMWYLWRRLDAAPGD